MRNREIKKDFCLSEETVLICAFRLVAGEGVTNHTQGAVCLFPVSAQWLLTHNEALPMTCTHAQTSTGTQ